MNGSSTENQLQCMQLAAGHPDKFIFLEDKKIIKKCRTAEGDIYKKLQDDSIATIMPSVFQVCKFTDDISHVTMENLLCRYTNPSVMDIKMGSRTHRLKLLEGDSDEPKTSYYESVLELDPSNLTEKEHSTKLLTKMRYMRIRDLMCSTSTLSFRICGILNASSGFSERGYYTLKERDEIKQQIADFVSNSQTILQVYLDRLQEIKTTLAKSVFFASHELIGSSLLFLHEADKTSNHHNANIWMIDFGKATQLKSDCFHNNHHRCFSDGTDSQEDGYLLGLDNLISIFQDLVKTLNGA